MSELARLVRDALARLVNSWPQWADATPSVFRARLLDECGRDARALATLLTRVIELGITDRISATSRDARTWSSVRGTFVMTLMHDGFILPEMSAWAVDAWGVALLGTTVVLPATLDGSAPSADPLATSASRCVPPRRPPPRGVHPGTRVAMGPTHMRPARSIITLVPATSGSRPTPRPGRHHRRNVSARGGGIVLVLALALGAGTLARRTEHSPPSAEQERAPRPVDGVHGALTPATPLGPTITSAMPVLIDTTALQVEHPGLGAGSSVLSTVARGSLPRSSSSAGLMLRVDPPQRAEGAVGPGARVLQHALATLSTTPEDRAQLTSGLSVTGRVEVVRPSTIIFRDGNTGLRQEVAKREIREIITGRGTRIRFSDVPTPHGTAATSRREKGVAGRYRMRYTLLDVSGSVDCRVARPPADASDLLIVEHLPGADTLNLAIDAGHRWSAVIDEAGRFSTAIAIQPDQAYSSSAFTSQLAGRFDANRLEGEVTLYSYRRVRVGRDPACQTTLKAVGEREQAARSPMN